MKQQPPSQLTDPKIRYLKPSRLVITQSRIHRGYRSRVSYTSCRRSQSSQCKFARGKGAGAASSMEDRLPAFTVTTLSCSRNKQWIYLRPREHISTAATSVSSPIPIGEDSVATAIRECSALSLMLQSQGERVIGIQLQ